MKRILLLILICSGLAAKSQVYNNEWIDYNKTYYKFKVGTTGLYRISQSVLNGIGLGSTAAQDFQLWRNGEEVPLYTSVSSGPLGGSDYIEFWGLRNDGKPEKALFRDTANFLNDYYSYMTDTAAFFLTVNPSASNKRLVNTVNDIAGNTLSPEPYFNYTLAKFYGDRFNPGYAALVGDSYVYSSEYDKGEGLSSNDIGNGVNVNNTYNNLHVYAAGPTPVFRINASGNAINPRTFSVHINGTPVIAQTMDFFDDAKVQTAFPMSVISGNTASIDVKNECTYSFDRMVIHKFEMVYPRQFNFDNLKNFTFELPANPSGNYLEISNFNYGSSATPPVLYDLTNGARYIADVSNPAFLRIKLQPSAVDRKLVLISTEPSTILSVTSPFITRNFINYGVTANQGNFVIISNPFIYTATDGSHPIDDYKAYRSSAAGGSYNAQVYDINEIVDQFGFGIKKHPISIKNFLQYAYDHFASRPQYVFLIGKGVVYTQYRIYQNFPDNTNQYLVEHQDLVPTFGIPASDNLFTCFNGSNIPSIHIGRLSAINADEVQVYLKKVKDYESAQAFSSPYIADKAWMKNVVHVVGADDGSLQTLLNAFIDKYSDIIKDTLFGASVNKFSKTSADAVQQLNSQRLQNLFEEGISLITYFGHSSASTLEFNLDDPSTYNNQGKYPVFMTLGCNAGNFFNINPARFLTKETISEKFVLAPERGSIGFIASTSLGIVQYLDIIATNHYIAMSRTKYGSTLGEIMDETIARTFDITTQNDFYARLHCEQVALNGDPALRYNTHAKPDYVIEDPLLKISPSFISVAETSFNIDAKMLNIGKAIDTNIVVEVSRTYPSGLTQVIQRDTIRGIRYIDSIHVNVPIVATRDKGLNRITITVDADHVVDELYETNNTLVRDVFIYEDEARPVYPYNLSIVNRQNIKLTASTANPLAALKQYKMELDTTSLFNSPFKVSQSVNSTGGVLEFNPGITFTDSTVYYWRVAQIPATGLPKWNEASFIYLPGTNNYGYNQSHFFQHTESTEKRLILDSASRSWVYDSLPHNLFVKNGVFITATDQEGDLIVSVDGVAYIRSACIGYSLVFNVFDQFKMVPRINLTGQYGSAAPCSPGREFNYEFSYMTPASRKLAMDFMDSIPNGAFVVLRNIMNYAQPSGFVNEWKNDTLIYGSGNSLYHKIKNIGFDQIDSFTQARAFAYIYQKNVSGFQPVGIISQGNYDIISLSKDMRTPDTVGFTTSPVFGPAKQWKQLHWRGASVDASAGDQPTVDVIGVQQDGTEVTLFSGLTLANQDFDVSTIDPLVYPYARLKMKNQDSIHFTPYQLRYWRLDYVPVPEGAIAPNIYLQAKDTLDIGEPMNFAVAFKNVSDMPFDSLRVKLTITNKNNVTTIIPLPRFKPLTPSDTVTVRYNLDTKNFAGLNNLYVEVNPNLDQPEQYHFNNFAFKNFYVKPDSLNPLLDVTFDGVHILNKDIVSSKPHVIVKLKDEAKWLILTDTSLMTVKVRFPDGSVHRYNFNSDTLRFTPAGPAPNNDNTASIDFLPYFPGDGEYELTVTGKDESNNLAGNIEYRVSFEVINKPMISNMLNYPNPFTTSTAFVFTVTGSEVPQNIKIEILTITGKIVREITRDELGPLHIGRNITEFKWDGTDQYGQKLANGIYLYRVVTNLNGKSLDKYKASDDNTDKYFNKGYGKMYLMR
jgi:hypothetical protein